MFPLCQRPTYSRPNSNHSEKAYNLSLFRQSSESGKKDALRLYKDAFPSVEAILIGIRRTDPRGVHACHPILDWSYSDVWSFLRISDVAYYSLYGIDIGYTSLGSTYNAFPNPALLIEQQDTDSTDVNADIALSSNSRRYRPVHELRDEKLERAGRGPSVSMVQQDSIPVSLFKRIVPPLPVPPGSGLPTAAQAV